MLIKHALELKEVLNHICSLLCNCLQMLLCKLFTTQSPLLTTLKKMALENTMGKGENAGNLHFLLFPQCFLLSLNKRNSHF